METLIIDISKPLLFSSSGLFISDENWVHTLRKIDTYELIIVVKGIVYIEIMGVQYELEKGDILLIPPYTEHKGYAPLKKGSSFYWFHFSVIENNTPIKSDFNSESSTVNFSDNYIKIPLHVKNVELNKLLILAVSICHINQSCYCSKKANDYMFTSLLIEISEQFSKTEKIMELSGNIEKIQEWIRINIARDISLKDISYEFNYSKEYLSRYFHKKVGTTVQNYINTLKINKAKELLLNTDNNVKTISQMLGFNNYKYFLRLFNKHENITPKSYRNAYSKTHYNKE